MGSKPWPTVAASVDNIREAVRTPKVDFGPSPSGQDCDSKSAGARTGFVPASLLTECGCSLVELGHAERRAGPMNETDALIAEKVTAALGEGLVPLVCVGEKQAAGEATVHTTQVSQRGRYNTSIAVGRVQ